MKFELHHGDCLDVLKTMADNSVDSIVTDPPAGISFMGKEWDHHKGGRDSWIAWMQQIAVECARVLKPGGHALVWSIPRTSHWTAMAWENAGFEVRDNVAHIFGSGFPKSLDVSRAIGKSKGFNRGTTPDHRNGPNTKPTKGNKYSGGYSGQIDIDKGPATDAARQWQGWGTALKPAREDWWLLRKPLIGTVADNVLKHGTGALNIDGCRVETADDLNGGAYSAERKPTESEWGGTIHKSTGRFYAPPSGRWPANLIHDGSDEVLAQFPNAPGQQCDISETAPSAKTSNVYGAMNRTGEPSSDSNNIGAVGFKMKPGARRLDSGSAARFFYCAKASRSDRDEGCNSIPEIMTMRYGERDQGSLSKQAPSKPVLQRNHHPTVKPLDLMRYLCRLVTPPGGTILDPFTGSGSTGKAAMYERFNFIGIERELEYIEIAKARIEHAQKDASTTRHFRRKVAPKPQQETGQLALL